MRTISITALILICFAILAVAGFLLYLNWAFSPKGPSRSGPASSTSVRAQGALAGGRFFAIVESRTQGSTDVQYIVQLGTYLEQVRQGQAGTVLMCRNRPVPAAVRDAPGGLIEVEFDQPVLPSGQSTLRIDPQQVQSKGFIQIENGDLVP